VRNFDREMNESKQYEDAAASLFQGRNQLLLKYEKLEQTKSEIESNVAELDKFLKENDKREEDLDIDEYTDTTDPLTQQYQELVADDRTMEEVQYYLNNVFTKGKLDLPTFLKINGDISREQFFKRAAINKINKIEGKQ